MLVTRRRCNLPASARELSANADPTIAACVADQLQLLYDPSARDFRDAPSVETRVVDFGSTRGFLADTPADRDLCMGAFVEALERAGYRDGVTAPPSSARRTTSGKPPLRGASRAARSHGSPGGSGRSWSARAPKMAASCEGGYFALEFLNRSPTAWRRRHVKHHPAVFRVEKPMVVTRARNYSAHYRCVPEFFAALGLPLLAAALYETRALPMKLGFRAPLVPTTCVIGIGVPTMERETGSAGAGLPGCRSVGCGPLGLSIRWATGPPGHPKRADGARETACDARLPRLLERGAGSKYLGY
ncbi:LOW QUALITY PROTEIN: hypothetical protein U9M48_028908 [Paspalum notatum var. saurae]|uniref:Uncharacterized protein n=1 Tax=Paspalum notatum var. saurae TaxID=547442 RepID=A0AAQ3U260_PASNO